MEQIDKKLKEGWFIAIEAGEEHKVVATSPYGGIAITITADTLEEAVETINRLLKEI